MRIPLGYQQITNLTGVVSLAVPAGARSVDLQAEVADVRFRVPLARRFFLLPAGLDR